MGNFKNDLKDLILLAHENFNSSSDNIKKTEERLLNYCVLLMGCHLEKHFLF